MPLFEPERAEINDFAVLWSIYEGNVHNAVHGKSANAQRIIDAVALLKSEDRLSLDRLGDAIRHFKSRYFDGAKLTYEFRDLHFGLKDPRDLVENFVRDNTKDEAEILSAILIIIYRLRCNFFHGTKWQYGMKGQLENFHFANVTLMVVIEMHCPNLIHSGRDAIRKAHSSGGTGGEG